VPRGPGFRLLAQDSFEAATCPVAMYCGLRAIKVNKYHLVARPSSSLLGHAHVSSKALYDKDGVVRLQGMQQVAH
jgi:hypothetical protein